MEKKFAAAAVVGLLAMTGCADVEQEESEPTPDDAPTAEVASDSGTEAPEQDEEDLEEEDEEEDALNERGNVPMPENSPQEFSDLDSGETLVDFEASDVHRDFTCDRVSAIQPDGILFAVDFEISVSGAAANGLPEGFLLNPPHFEIIDRDGSVIGQEATTHAANNCLNDEDKYPITTLRAGSSASGPVVFETPVESGYLVYWDMYVGDYFEWEFDFSS